MNRIILLTLLLSAGSFYGISQTTPTSNTPVLKTVHGSQGTVRFGQNPSAVADYLTSRNLLSEETITFKRAIFRLLIDQQGKVTDASLFSGGITLGVNEQMVAAFRSMPAWKTTLKAGEQAMVYVVVQIKEQIITTELY